MGVTEKPEMGGHFPFTLFSLSIIIAALEPRNNEHLGLLVDLACSPRFEYELWRNPFVADQIFGKP
jgi:hypothetical protein